jgi:hypothetical protein
MKIVMHPSRQHRRLASQAPGNLLFAASSTNREATVEDI